MGTYISIKSTVNAFRYGIDPIPEWFDKISNKTDEVDVMVEGDKVKGMLWTSHRRSRVISFGSLGFALMAGWPAPHGSVPG